MLQMKLAEVIDITPPEERDLRQKLAQLLNFISSLAWYKIPRDGKIPEYPTNEDFECCGGEDPVNNGGITPVHRGADWVVFDTEYWCLHVPDKYFVEFVDAEQGSYVPDEPRRDRLRDYEMVLPYERNQPSCGVDCRMEEWQEDQPARVRSHDAELATRLERRIPRQGSSDASTVWGGISRRRTTPQPAISASLAAYLAREGITDLETFLAMQDGITRISRGNDDQRSSDGGAGPSNA